MKNEGSVVHFENVHRPSGGGRLIFRYGAFDRTMMS